MRKRIAPVPIAKAVQSTPAEKQTAYLQKVQARLDRLGKRNLYWFKKGTYESTVTRWFASTEDKAKDPEAYKQSDAQFQAVKRRISAYQSWENWWGGSFIRFLIRLSPFNSISRDLELLCYFHCRFLYESLSWENPDLKPQAVWSSYIDEFTSEDLKDGRDLHPARDMKFLGYGRRLRLNMQALLKFLPALKKHLPQAITVPMPSNSLHPLAPEGSNPGLPQASSSTALALPSQRIEDCYSVLGVAVDAKPDAAYAAYLREKEALGVASDEPALERLHVAYQQVLSNSGLDEAAFRAWMQREAFPAEQIETECALYGAFRKAYAPVHAVMNQVASEQAALRAGFAEVRAGQERVRAGQERVRAGQERVRAGQERVRAGCAELDAGQERVRAGQAKNSAACAEVRADQAAIAAILDDLEEKAAKHDAQKAAREEFEKQTAEINASCSAGSITEEEAVARHREAFLTYQALCTEITEGKATTASVAAPAPLPLDSSAAAKLGRIEGTTLSDKQAALFSADPDADAAPFPVVEDPDSHLRLIEAAGGAGSSFSAY